MSKEELDSFENLNIDLTDIDELDMGLEIISYKVRETIQNLADCVLKRNSVIFDYQDKINKIEEYIKENPNEVIKCSDLSNIIKENEVE